MRPFPCFTVRTIAPGPTSLVEATTAGAQGCASRDGGTAAGPVPVFGSVPT